MLTHEEEPTAATEPSPYAPSPTGGASQGNGTGASYASCGVRVGLEEVNSCFEFSLSVCVCVYPVSFVPGFMRDLCACLDVGCVCPE